MTGTSADDLLPAIMEHVEDHLMLRSGDTSAQLSALTESSAVTLCPDAASGNLLAMKRIQRRFKVLQRAKKKRSCPCSRSLVPSGSCRAAC